MIFLQKIWRAQQESNPQPLDPKNKSGLKLTISETLDRRGNPLTVGGFPIFTVSAGIGQLLKVTGTI